MIGVFDSGLGGLTVLNSIRSLLPDQALIYVADQAYTPYGDQSEATVTQRSREISQWLIEQGCQLIVIACNTATAIAIDQLRREFSVPIVGVEPGVKPAALLSRTRKIGILATENTVASQRYQRLIQAFLPNVQVISQGCSGLADAIESDPEAIPALLQKYLCPLLDEGVDQVVLGCTHYPLIRSQIEQLAGARARVIDTSDAIAMEVRRRLPAKTSNDVVDVRWYTTKFDASQAGRLQHYDQLKALAGVQPEALNLP
ncbi:glutamate racemase [Reinekea blandensis]|uniref:Glutamate racemase n=1 Tax=Reinekea blandensis MED297 TaxID=314283 RepID=A4BEQ2_9GAMM|nr:glutamate racemase [Reinekea blandensis]EAR09479.1 glutamate racemase [Reinekea sp. MED297] [Reinekea blandensis MED297]